MRQRSVVQGVLYAITRGTGLFRYLPDDEALGMLAAVEKVAVKID